MNNLIAFSQYLSLTHFHFVYFDFAEGLISYNIPKGVQRGFDIDLSDHSYDGQDEGDRLIGGLGQLVDGTRGSDNYRSDANGFGKGKH